MRTFLGAVFIFIILLFPMQSKADLELETPSMESGDSESFHSIHEFGDNHVQTNQMYSNGTDAVGNKRITMEQTTTLEQETESLRTDVYENKEAGRMWMDTTRSDGTGTVSSGRVLIDAESATVQKLPCTNVRTSDGSCVYHDGGMEKIPPVQIE